MIEVDSGATRPKRMRIVARVVVLPVAAALALACAELVTAVALPQPKSWLDIYDNHEVLPFPTLAKNVSSLVDTGETSWHVYTNASRFRGTKDVVTISDRPSALVLGDSFAFGHGVDHEQTFVGLVNAIQARFYFVNAAVPGYGPVQYRMVLEYELEKGNVPAMVIAATFVGNDFLDCGWDKNRTVIDGIIGNRTGPRSWLKRNLHLYRAASRVYHRIWGSASAALQSTHASLYQPSAWGVAPLSDDLVTYRNEFRLMRDLCKKYGIPFVCCIIPTATSVEATRKDESLLDDGADFAFPAARAARVFEYLQIGYIDTTQVLADIGAAEAYFVYDGHLTPAGHRAVAEVLAEFTMQTVDMP